MTVWWTRRDTSFCSNPLHFDNKVITNPEAPNTESNIETATSSNTEDTEGGNIFPKLNQACPDPLFIDKLVVADTPSPDGNAEAMTFTAFTSSSKAGEVTGGKNDLKLLNT